LAITRSDFPNFTIIKDLSAGLTSEKDVMGGPCRVTHIRLKNSDVAIAFLKLFDDVNPVGGTTAPDFILPIEGSAENDGYLDYPINGGKGIKFPNGLSFGASEEPGTVMTTGPTTLIAVLHCLKGVS